MCSSHLGKIHSLQTNLSCSTVFGQILQTSTIVYDRLNCNEELFTFILFYSHLIFCLEIVTDTHSVSCVVSKISNGLLVITLASFEIWFQDLSTKNEISLSQLSHLLSYSVCSVKCIMIISQAMSLSS